MFGNVWTCRDVLQSSNAGLPYLASDHDQLQQRENNIHLCKIAY